MTVLTDMITTFYLTSLHEETNQTANVCMAKANTETNSRKVISVNILLLEKNGMVESFACMKTAAASGTFVV